MLNKRDLRQVFLFKRMQLPLEEQQQKSKQLIQAIAPCSQFFASKKIAAYWPTKGEINPLSLVEQAYKLGKQCYLPSLLIAQRKLQFLEYQPGDLLASSTLGIPEPDPLKNSTIDAINLDIILIPLVAFDKAGHRLGMGSGYYDRTFAFVKDPAITPKPYLLGVAYDWQEVETLATDPWDVPLNGIVTEKRYIDGLA